MLTGWINEEQFMPFVEILSQFYAHELDDNAAEALFSGIQGTNYAKGEWVEHSFAENTGVCLRLARDKGTRIIFLELKADREIEQKAEIVLQVLDHLRTRQCWRFEAKISQ